MTIAEKITNDWKTALKSGLPEKALLSSMIAEIKNKAINTGTDRTNVGDELVIAVLDKMFSERKDTIEIYRTGGKSDRAEAEEIEISLIRRYMPAQMSSDEVNSIIVQICAGLNVFDSANPMSQAGLIMKQLSPQIKGRFEGKQAMQMVSTYLKSKG
jgi:uncharacterized protein YqeY